MKDPAEILGAQELMGDMRRTSLSAQFILLDTTFNSMNIYIYQYKNYQEINVFLQWKTLFLHEGGSY